MKRALLYLSYALIAALVFGGSFFIVGRVHAESPVLPGINADDAHPKGCVDCHRAEGGNDYRINVFLAKVKDHPDVNPFTKNVPDDCAMCHKQGAPTGALSLIIHKSHYANPGENHFVSGYQGSCLECHELDIDSGAMSVKSGAKNW